MAHTGPHKVKMSGWIDFAPFERLLNMSIESADEGRAVLTMPFVLELAQGAGMMHGGALVSLADTACCIAVKGILAPGTHFGTIEMQSRIVAPVKAGIVRAEAVVRRQAGRELDTEATVYDTEDRPVMHFSATFKVARDSRIKNAEFSDTP